MIDQFFYRYFFESTLFALGHLFVLGSLILSVGTVLSEAKSLKNYNPNPKSHDDKQQTVNVLNSFVRECVSQAQQGNFVPMTDFSDRLDSMVDGMISEIHDKANLFLVVGIMGTMWGVFDFAINAPDIFTKPETVALGLSNSIGKAFPVGIMGVFLTILAQMLIGFPEKWLRSALASATELAIERRRSLPKQSDVGVLSALGDIRNAINGLQQMNLAMQPIVDATLALRQSSKLMIESSTSLQTTVENLRSSTSDSLGDLKEATTGLKSLLKDTPKVLKSFMEIQDKHEKWLLQYKGEFDTIALNLVNSTEELAQIQNQIKQLPIDLAEISSKELRQMRTEIGATWATETNAIATAMYETIKGHFGKVEEKAQLIQSKIDSAQRTYDELLADLRQVEERVINGIINAIKNGEPDIVDSFVKMTQHMKDAANTAKIAKEELVNWKLQVSELQGEMKKLSDSIGQSGHNFAEAFGNGIKEFEGQIIRIAQKLKAFDTAPIVDRLNKGNQLLRQIAKTNFIIAIQRWFFSDVKELLRTEKHQSN